MIEALSSWLLTMQNPSSTSAANYKKSVQRRKRKGVGKSQFLLHAQLARVQFPQFSRKNQCPWDLMTAALLSWQLTVHEVDSHSNPSSTSGKDYKTVCKRRRMEERKMFSDFNLSISVSWERLYFCQTWCFHVRSQSPFSLGVVLFHPGCNSTETYKLVKITFTRESA